MLNIATISAGSGMDYLQEEVATSAHDYYVGEAESVGRWYGRGTDELGLAGEVQAEQVERAYGAAVHPVTGAALGQKHPMYRTMDERIEARLDAEGPDLDDDRRAAIVAEEHRKGERSAKAGYDLTLRPVKSVSVLWAVGSPEVQAVVQRAHDEAVEAALDYVETHVAGSRAGRNGVRAIDLEGITVARYTHRTSRNGDPLLHTHSAVLNRAATRDDDGELRYRAIDGTRLFEAGPAINARYTAHLEARLTSHLGVGWEQRPDGGREIAGVPQQVLRAWSSRRVEIESRYDELAEQYRQRHGRSPGRDAKARLQQIATLQTRQAKHSDEVDAGGLHDRWRSDYQRIAEETPGELERRVLHRHDADGAVAVEDVAAAALAQLESSRATWNTNHVDAALVMAAPSSLTADSAAVEQLILAGRAAVEARSVALPRPRPIESGPRRASGESVYDRPTAAQWTSQRVLDWEQLVLEAGGRQQQSPLPDHVLGAAVEGHGLDAQQHHAAMRIGTDQHQVQALIGPAGTGKTRTLGAVADAWCQAGGRILGTAVSQTATEVLSESIRDAGTAEEAVAADNLAHLLDFSDHLERLDRNTLVVVDEAGMVPTEGLSRLVAAAIAAGSRVVLVGDHRQLPSVEAGGLLRAFVAEHGAAELDIAHRFTEDWEREASLRLRAQQPEAIDTYSAHGRVHGGDRGDMLDQALVAWQHDRAAGLDSLLVVSTNEDAADMSGRARQLRIAAGHVDGGGSTVALRDGNAMSTGDEIVTRLNNRLLIAGTRGDFVKNRDTWTVEKIYRTGDVAVKHRGHGGRAILPKAYVAEHVELAYAGTVHIAQGRTVDTCHLVVTEADSSESLYVGATRGRSSNQLWVATDGLSDHLPESQPPETVLAGVLARSSTPETATEVQEAGAADLLSHLVPALEDARHQLAQARMSARWAAAGLDGPAPVGRDAQLIDRALQRCAAPVPTLVAAGRDASGSQDLARRIQHLAERGFEPADGELVDAAVDHELVAVVDELEKRIVSRRVQITEDLEEAPPSWMSEIQALADSDRWLERSLGVEVAEYRERWGVVSDTNVAVPAASVTDRPGQAVQRARLEARIQAHGAIPGGATLMDLDRRLAGVEALAEQRTLHRRLDALGHPGLEPGQGPRAAAALRRAEERGLKPMDALAGAVESDNASGGRGDLIGAIDEVAAPGRPSGLVDPGRAPEDLAAVQRLTEAKAERVAALRGSAVTEPWAAGIQGSQRRQLAGDVAVWRDTHGVEGPEPLGGRDEARLPGRAGLARRLRATRPDPASGPARPKPRL